MAKPYVKTKEDAHSEMIAAQTSNVVTIDVDAATTFADELTDAAAGREVVPVTHSRLPSRATQTNLGEGFEGEFLEEDIKRPRLTIVNGSGKMSHKWRQGDLVLDDSLVFPCPEGLKEGPLLRFVVGNIKKQWRENLTPDQVAEGTYARIVDTMAEADAIAGPGSTVSPRGSGIRPKFSASARCLLLLERPEGNDSPAFAYEVGGKWYAPAVYYASTGAFYDFAQKILSESASKLRERSVPNPTKKFWTVCVQKKKVGNYFAYRPVVRLTNDPTSEEVRAICAGASGRNVLTDSQLD